MSSLEGGGGSFKNVVSAKSDDEVLSQLSAELGDDNKPYYWDVDNEDEDYKNKHDYDALSLEEGIRPDLDQLVFTCMAERQSEHVLYEQGMWVEYRSNDMKWKVGRVNRVIKQPPDDWDFETQGRDVPDERLLVSYNVGVEGVVEEDSIRAPTEGLKAICGKRPWLWQQFTLLQLEKRVRFDEDHEYDFEEIDNIEFATTRYDAWLHTEANIEFKNLHDQLPLATQKMLRSNLFMPFSLMDIIIERPKEWDFDDPDISIYTYTAALGSGLLTLMSIVMVQLLIPLVLIYNNIITTDGGPSERFFVNESDQVFRPENGNFLPGTDLRRLCRADPNDIDDDQLQSRPEGKVLLAMVIVIYLLDIVPDSALSFFRTSGGYDTTYSKINSLRNIVWEQNDDDIVQEIGFKVDRIMNTGYLCLLYMLMLFVLMNTPIVLDIILNALAIDFIHKIDERIADADWWDEDNRWIKAGTFELIIQGALRLRVLESANKICSEYDIDKGKYNEALGGMLSLCNRNLALKDDGSVKYMTKKEVLFTQVAQQALAADDYYVLAEYQKEAAQFGLIDVLLSYCGRTKGVFRRYPEYRVWSRWEKVLFLPHVPKSIDPDTNNQVPVVLGKADSTEFIEHVIAVLTFLELFDNLRTSYITENYTRIPVKLFFGVAEWFLYLATIIFPIVVLAALFIVPICY